MYTKLLCIHCTETAAAYFCDFFLQILFMQPTLFPSIIEITHPLYSTVPFYFFIFFYLTGCNDTSLLSAEIAEKIKWTS